MRTNLSGAIRQLLSGNPDGMTAMQVCAELRHLVSPQQALWYLSRQKKAAPTRALAYDELEPIETRVARGEMRVIRKRLDTLIVCGDVTWTGEHGERLYRLKQAGQ